MYGLPHPLFFLDEPMKKESFKTLVKKRIISYWENQLRLEASTSPSLSFFKPEFMSLCKPHPLLSSPGSSPSKVSMAIVQATMLSGRYRTQSLLRHWRHNVSGNCLMAPECQYVSEDIVHILQQCPGLFSARNKLLDFTSKFCSSLPTDISKLILELCHPDHPAFVKFLLDCSSLPQVIFLVQSSSTASFTAFFDVSRMWIYVLHRERLKRLGQWKHRG